jgi:uncharacterized repeat protein (TIGR01451 family)
VLGGLTAAGSSSSKVYSAYIESDGRLRGDPKNPSRWQEEVDLELPTPLYRHAAIPAQNGGIYVIGGENNDDINQSQVYYLPLLSLTKSADPPGSVHEGDVITYTLAYANTSLISHTITISDILPFNVRLVPGSVSTPGVQMGPTLSWNIGELPPGGSGKVFFQARVSLLPFLQAQEEVGGLTALATTGPVHILPAPVACDTTRFWANGLTRQPPVPNPHTIYLQIPPGSAPSAMWLLMKGTNNLAPTVAGQPTQLIQSSNDAFGASVWYSPITPTMIVSNQFTVVTKQPRELNTVMLFDEADPPFDITVLEDFFDTTKTFTYTLDIPSVASQTIDVIIPFMDLNYLTDDLLPDDRITTITAQFGQQSETVVVSDPNLGNGLLMTQFPFEIGPLSDVVTSTKVLTVKVETEDSLYTLGPRVCRPVYIENMAWLCSEQAGCVSASVRNAPGDVVYPGGVYLPIIMKSSSP